MNFSWLSLIFRATVSYFSRIWLKIFHNFRYVPEYFYPRSTYPDFLCGVGFLMSGDVALRLYRESFKFKLFFLEDMFITGNLAWRVDLKLIKNVERYSCLPFLEGNALLSFNITKSVVVEYAKIKIFFLLWRNVRWKRQC